MLKKYNNPVGLSLTIAAMALIAFSYLAFLGLVLHYRGALLKPLLITIIGLWILIKCLFVICKSKRKRLWRQGLFKEILALLIALTVLGLGSVPVSRLFTTWEKEMEVQNAAHKTISSIISMSAAYNKYVNNRIDNYKATLMKLDVNSSLYHQAVSGAGGENKIEKVNLICSSLRRRIYPNSFDSMFRAQNDWLMTLPKFNIWNIFAARNNRIIGETGKEWNANLVKLSSTFYLAEEAEPFNYQQVSDDIISFEREYTRYCMPSFTGILALIVCFILVLLPYLLIRRPTTGK